MAQRLDKHLALLRLEEQMIEPCDGAGPDDRGLRESGSDYDQTVPPCARYS